MIIISLILLTICLFPLAYLYTLALASVRVPPKPSTRGSAPAHRFFIAIPAHNEASVIASTVRRLHALDYPADLFDVHIVADHCSDGTVALAMDAGALVHERNTGPRSGKGAALSWLFRNFLDGAYDAVVIFDADTRVDAWFLHIMDAHLSQGEDVIQGQHVISNPQSGWFPALTWAMFLIDNRFQNLGRANLGWSAKHMGDSICFRADVLRQIGWGEGLTEDYHLRQKLLLEGVKIAYEPNAVGRGEAPLTWMQARKQRERWLRGTHDASQTFARRLLVEGLRRGDLALLDGALQAHLPSYSTLTMIGAFALLAQFAANGIGGSVFPPCLLAGWGAMLGAIFVYPLLGLFLEKAPLRAYLAILSGPVFIVWRTWLALTSRFGGRNVVWIRTAHGEEQK
jgi:cellulose synthase/poly-beta-1,6-N-acetylglucosamine synthase-like glycosyltransferase